MIKTIMEDGVQIIDRENIIPVIRKEDWENFKNSAIWNDMLTEMNIRLEQLRGVTEVETDEVLYRAQGGCRMLRQIMTLPDDIMFGAEQDIEDE